MTIWVIDGFVLAKINESNMPVFVGYKENAENGMYSLSI